MRHSVFGALEPGMNYQQDSFPNSDRRNGLTNQGAPSRLPAVIPGHCLFTGCIQGNTGSSPAFMCKYYDAIPGEWHHKVFVFSTNTLCLFSVPLSHLNHLIKPGEEGMCSQQLSKPLLCCVVFTFDTGTARLTRQHHPVQNVFLHCSSSV